MEEDKVPFEETKHYDAFMSAYLGDLQKIDSEAFEKEANNHHPEKVTPTSQNYLG